MLSRVATARAFAHPPTRDVSAATTRAFDAVLFDLDGTLADSAADISLALQRAFDDLSLSPPGDIAALVDGSPLEETFAVVAPGGTPEDFTRFVRAYRTHYAAGHHGLTRLYPGVAETLEALHQLRPRIRLAIATAKRADVARDLAVALGIARFFDRIDGSSGTELRHKPAPDLLEHVTSALGVSPSRTVMVGDTVRDILAGRAAGMRTAAVLYGLGASDTLLAAGPDFVLEDIEDLVTLVADNA